MELRFTIRYHEDVKSEDIPRLDTKARERIRNAIEERLETKPDLYGKPLRRSLQGYRKLRVGDYRVIFRIERGTVKVLVIAHRGLAYQIAHKRV